MLKAIQKISIYSISVAVAFSAFGASASANRSAYQFRTLSKPASFSASSSASGSGSFYGNKTNYEWARTYSESPAKTEHGREYSELLVDAKTGKIIHQKNADETCYPASLAKMMTIYLTFEQVRAGKLRLDQQIPVSKYAATMPRTNLALRAGERIKVSDALLGLVIHSANDAAVVLAEAISGDERKFAKYMTTRARQLGMKNTTFANASGLFNPNQVTTAKDLAVLGFALKNHYPKYYPLFSRETFVFKGRTYASHNNITKGYEGANGIKTGYIGASGFNVVSTAKRPEGELLGVVIGGQSAYTRDTRMSQMLNSGFSTLKKNRNQYAGRFAGAKSNQR